MPVVQNHKISFAHLSADSMTLKDIQGILCDPSSENLEKLAREASAITRYYFGRAISLYAPLYLSNYCSSRCTYCGFSNHQRIKRVKLTSAQMHAEMKHIAASGIQNILLLTGESYRATPLPYLLEAITIAKEYFPSISLEVHPMETAEYRKLFEAGVDGVTIYQETYNKARYAKVHLSGKKRDYDFRYGAPERIAKAGMRQISMGILLGLYDVAEDIFELFRHLRTMEKQFPGVEYSLSFPRLRPIKGMNFIPSKVDDVTFVKVICLARILFPRVGINLSTRENENVRDHALELGITKISAASKTSVGGYITLPQEDLAPQFDIQDERSVDEIVKMLKKRNFDPVFTDWRRITNE